MNEIEMNGGPFETAPATPERAADTTVRHAEAAQPRTAGPAKRRLPFLLRAPTYVLAAPFAVARALLRTGPAKRARREAMSALGAAFDTAFDTLFSSAFDALVAPALERLQYNATLKAFLRVTIHDQLGALDERMVAGLVQAQVEGLIARLNEDPALLHGLVQQLAESYLESLRREPAAANALVQQLAGEYLGDLHAQPEAVVELVRVVAARYIAHLSAQPELVDELVQAVGAQYIAHLDAHPELTDPLVEEVAARLIDRLRADPGALHALVEIVGDRYIAYLRTNPQGVQELLQGQSQTLANEIVGGVRDRSASADQTLENLVRSLLGGRSGRKQSSGL